MTHTSHDIEMTHTSHDNEATRERGFSLIELMFGVMTLTIGALGAYGIIIAAVASNSRNLMDSTMAMLTDAVIEQVNSTLVGSGQAFLTDCRGTSFTINTAPGGATVTGGLGSDIDYSAAQVTNYSMNYAVMSPCDNTGRYLTTYDVRWRVDQIGAAAATPTSSFLVSVAAKRQGLGLPIQVKVMLGRPE
jgi:hypothetical protein